MNDQTPDTLRAVIDAHAISLDSDRLELLDRYRRLLWSANEQLNLTRHTTCELFVTRDLVDSQAITPYLADGERLLDVGTGGGVPGIVLHILRPDLNITLCESVGKKARAVEAIVGQLEIPVQVEHARAEELLGKTTFDTLVARAVAPLPKLLYWLKPRWGSFSRLIVIKGRSWEDEQAEAQRRGVLDGLTLERLTTYATPGTQAESVVLEIRRDEKVRRVENPSYDLIEGFNGGVTGRRDRKV